MLYLGDKNYIEFAALMDEISEAYGFSNFWLQTLEKVNPELGGKCRRQLDRVNALMSEETPVSEVSLACASMVKGMRLAKAALANVPRVQKDYIVAALPSGVKVRIYTDRAAIPNGDGAGEVACVAAPDLLGFLPDGILEMLRIFSGASISRLIDDNERASKVAAKKPVSGARKPAVSVEVGPEGVAMQAVIDMPDDIPN